MLSLNDGSRRALSSRLKEMIGGTRKLVANEVVANEVVV